MALASIYAFLSFTTLPFAPLLTAIDPAKALQIIIIFYYFLWVWGVNHDTDLQELVYATAPAEGKLRPSDIGVIILIFVVSVLLVWSIGGEQRFAGVLTIFFIVNIFSWRWLLCAIRPAIAQSFEIYRTEPEDFFSLERLNAFVLYISGHWQWFRFGAMGVVLAILNSATFSNGIRKLISDALARSYPALTSAQISRILPVVLFVFFIVVEEGWIWIMRMRTDFVLKVTSDLEQKYEIHPLI